MGRGATDPTDLQLGTLSLDGVVVVPAFALSNEVCHGYDSLPLLYKLLQSQGSMALQNLLSQL